MNRRGIWISAGIGALLIWAGYRVYIARADLVTLNVRDMDVRQVIPKMERQTWERIVANTNVAGLVTLNVRRVPLPEVLNIIALQTRSRWTALYPLYLRRDSTKKLEKVVSGETPSAGSGWSNLEKAPAWQGGGGSMFGQTARAANNLVSANIENKDLAFAALALSRFSQAQVVPEDNAIGTVNLKLEQVPFTKAVAQVAKQVRRKWHQIYTLQPMRNTVMVQNVNKPPPGTNTVDVAIQKISVDTNVVKLPPRAPTLEEKERQIEAFLATMTPAERTKAEEQLTTMQQLQTLPEGERQQRMQEMAAQSQQASQADLEQRVRKRLRDGTTDQRVARDKEKLGRTQQQQQQVREK